MRKLVRSACFFFSVFDDTAMSLSQVFYPIISHSYCHLAETYIEDPSSDEDSTRAAENGGSDNLSTTEDEDCDDLPQITQTAKMSQKMALEVSFYHFRGLGS